MTYDVNKLVLGGSVCPVHRRRSPIGGAILYESGAMVVILNAVRLLR